MGTGCEEVSRMSAADSDAIAGRWKDGRLGSVRANRPHGDFGAVVFRPKQIVQSDRTTARSSARSPILWNQSPTTRPLVFSGPCMNRIGCEQ